MNERRLGLPLSSVDSDEKGEVSKRYVDWLDLVQQCRLIRLPFSRVVPRQPKKTQRFNSAFQEVRIIVFGCGEAIDG